jgi:serine/threonine protein kinase
MEIRQIGRYEIQHRLGKGGMGSLYLARDPGLERLVAIKLLKDDYLDDQEFRERFAREARALARLRHPNIVVVYDFGEHEGRPFMAMEYIDGETLRQRLARTPPLKLALGLALVEDLCAGLANAHDAGIVHRDIKPDNIMVDRQGVVKLLDFGIARNAHAESTQQMTQPGMIMGTYNYMSPEQLLGEMVDKRSDIFAVGAVLYQVIAREQAFPGAFGAVYHRVLTAGPVPLEERVPGVDPTLVRIVTRALERDPQDRYQSATDMRRDLARARQRLADSSAAPAHETVVTPRTSSARRQRDSEAKRGLVAEQLRLGHEAFGRGDYDIALQYGERAAFVDPDNGAANELINKSRVAIDAKSILPLLDEARRLLSSGRIQHALTRAEEARAAVPDLIEATELRQEVQAVLDQIVTAREREDRINSSLERARLCFERGEYDTSLRAVYEVLALDPDRRQARDLEQQAKVKLQEQREHEQARRDAHDRVVAARSLADEGRLHEAAEALTAIVPPSDSVRSEIDEARALVDRLRRRAQVDAAVAEAREAAAAGHFTHAVSIIEAISADDLTAEARHLRADALESLARQRELQRQRQRLEELLASAEAFMEARDVTQARGRLAEAAKLGLEDARVDLVARRLEEVAARIDDQRRNEALNRRALEVTRQAEQLFARNPQEAVEFLGRSDITHPRVAATLAELREKLAEIEERARRERERQAEESRRAATRAEAERHREQQRLAAERKRQEDESREREQKRMAAERQRQEDDARERDRQRAVAEQQLRERDAPQREARKREEQQQATIVRPAKEAATEPAKAPAQVVPSRPAPNSKMLVAAAALAVIAIGSGLALYVTQVNETGRPDSAQVSQNGQPASRADQPAAAEPADDTQVENRNQDEKPTDIVTRPENPSPESKPPQNDANAQARRQAEIAAARTAINGAMAKGDLDLTDRLLTDAQRRFGAETFSAESQARARLDASKKDEATRSAAQELLGKSRQVRDNQGAIDLLNRALQIHPGDAAVQAELRRRTDAAAAEARQKEVAEKERQAQEARQRQERERADGLKTAQTAIDRALAQGELDAADKLLQEAEGQFGTVSFGAQRQQLSLKREQAAAAAATAEAERVRLQIRGVLDRFSQAYNSKDLAGLAVVWPSFPRDSYRGTFNTFESLSWVFNTCDIDVGNAGTATARCSVAIRRVDVRGRVTSESGRRQFVVRNAGGAWRIESLQEVR